MQNFGFFVPDNIAGYESEGTIALVTYIFLSNTNVLTHGLRLVWNIPASREDFLKSASELHPDLQAVCP
jgi:hypothetical protein